MRFQTPLTPIIISKLISSGGDVTPASIVTATGQMTDQQATATRDNIDGEPKRLTVTVTESSGTYTGNKTFAEMWTAYSTNHKTVTVAFADDEFVLSSADPSHMAFTSVSVGSGNATLSVLTVDISDDWSYAEFAAGVYTVTVSGTTPTIAPADNHIYNCGELSSLTISNPPASGKYAIIFYSGATPTTTVGIENFVAEANKRYKITVEDNYATYDSWDWEGV